MVTAESVSTVHSAARERAVNGGLRSSVRGSGEEGMMEEMLEEQIIQVKADDKLNCMCKLNSKFKTTIGKTVNGFRSREKNQQTDR